VEYKIVRIPTPRVNVYLIITGNRGILIDVGAKKYLPRLYEAIRENGLEPGDIRQIILTHTHYDHVDGLKEIREKTGAKILVHKNEADSLNRGYTSIPAGIGFIGKTVSFLGRKLYPSIGAYDPVSADILLDDSYQIGELGKNSRIIHTPGHSNGSVSLIIDNVHAFVGDCMFGFMRKRIIPGFANDIPQLMRSWQLLADTGCQVFYPGHGKPIDRERFDRNLSRCLNKYQ